MKRITLIISTLFWAIPAFLPVAASAHTTKVSGPLSVEYHLEPEDDPITGKSASLQFSFEDSTNKFSASNCNCMLTIRLGNKIIIRKTFSRNTARYGDQALVTNATFPKIGDYSIELAGTPTSKASFQPFDLTWSQTVSHQGPSGFTAKNLGIGMFIAALLAAFWFAIGYTRRKLNRIKPNLRDGQEKAQI